jgi:CBS-domain-containing membrane protein
MSLLRQGKAQALTIYIGESDQWRGTSAYLAIIQYLREQGCAGATVTRAIAGYGAGPRLHTSRKWQWPSNAPVIIHVIDQPDRLRHLLPHLQEMISGGLMTLNEVDILKYTHVRAQGMPTHLPVRSVMEPIVITCRPTDPIDTVINLLLDAPFRALPVIDEQSHLLGIIGTGDLIDGGIFPMRRGLLRKALELDDQSVQAIEKPLTQAKQGPTTAQDVMNSHIRTIGPDTSVREAAQIMIETQLRRLPVVSAGGVLLGMVTRTDLLQVAVTSPLMAPDASTKTQLPSGNGGNKETPPQQRPIGDYASPNVATVSKQTPLQEVIEALVLSPFKRVIVIDNQRQVVGIISDVDVLAQIQAESRPGFLTWLASWAKGAPEHVPTGVMPPYAGKAHLATDLMNREVVTVTAQTSVQQTIEFMITTHLKALPVVDTNHRLVGIVGRSDLLRVLLES